MIEIVRHVRKNKKKILQQKKHQILAQQKQINISFAPSAALVTCIVANAFLNAVIIGYMMNIHRIYRHFSQP